MSYMFVNYDKQTKAFRLYLLDKKKIAISKDVTFDEDRFGLEYNASTEPIDQPSILDFSMPPEEPTPNLDHVINPYLQMLDIDQNKSLPECTDSGNNHGDLPSASDAVQPEQPMDPSQVQSPPERSTLPIPRKYSIRNQKPSSRLCDYYVNYLVGTYDADPLSNAQQLVF